ASERVLQLASEFQCPVCIEKRRSQAVESYCDRHQIYLDVIPGEAHHQIGVCEESVKGLKEVMTKLCLADPEVSPEEALSTGICTFNQREHIRGFSPAQHILGVNPDEVGRCLPNINHVPPGLLVENATGEFRRAVERRSAAEKAHSEWNAAQRLLRASNSRAKPVYDYKPGDLVYFWRSQGGGQSRTQPGNKHGSFLGPARVLATETRKDQDGSLRPGSAIWCVRGRRLLKCAPEQLRHASTREEVLESLADSGQATPWTYTRVAEEIGGNQYEDLRDEIPDPSEWARAQDIHEEEPPTRHRARHKRRPDADTEQLRTEPTEVPSTSGPSRPSRAGPRGHPYRATASGHWTEETHETAWVTSHSAFWDDELACVALEVPVPETNRGINAFTRDLPTYFTTALRRQAMEVSEKRLTPEERESFRQAKSVEVKNFLAAQAFEALPEGLKPSRDQAIGMRWILTWKTKEDGSVKPKARAVLLGYQDPAYEHRSTTAPVMTRQTRQLMLQLTAVRQWTIQKGDVSGAFLQGSITRLKRACYGLVDAPLEWYRTIAIFLEELMPVKRVPEGFELSQPRYLEGLAEIPVNSQRRKSLEDPTTEREKSQLRALLGGDKEFSQDCATSQPALGPRQESQGTLSEDSCL
ncbi:RE1, partial [Symbiodinium sp. KB8]